MDADRQRGPLTLSEADRRVLATWAADCAERTLPLFEAPAPEDRRPRDAVDGLRAFSRREKRIGELRAEVIRVLADHQALTLAGLGELLVCETGSSPSRLVDRLVSAGLVRRESRVDDRRQVALSLTADGAALAQGIARVEDQLCERIDQLTSGGPVDEALTLLHSVARAFPAGQALGRREGLESHPPSDRFP